MKEQIKKILKDLPKSPGVYKMKNDDGEVLYIGKAKDLSKRVIQYFRKNYQHSYRTQKLVAQIDDIELISVDTELEAMILETNLIKQFKPKYNILMKDDKNYVYIKITDEDYPRIQIVRKVEKDGAKYIGPKSAAHKVKATFKVIKKIFPFRHCNLDIDFIAASTDPNIDHEVKVTRKVIKYPCLDFFIKRCAAPCIGKVTPQEYRKIIKNVENFLAGKADDILKELENEMRYYASQKKFEMAAKVRDKIQKVHDILEKQKVADASAASQDIINYCITQDQAYFNLFQVRDGKLLGQENFVLKAKDAAENTTDPEVLEAFIKQYYELATDIPKEILIPHKIDPQHELQKVKVYVPKIGKKRKLLEMSLNNACIYADRNKPKWYEQSGLTQKAAEELQEILKLEHPLKRIECYDISHLSGTDTVGSMIVFEKGAPKKDMYRKFKIRTVVGKPDDYKSMEEVLHRRFLRIALDVQQQEYKFKKARKKDFKFIEGHNKVKVDEVNRNFYILEKNKEILGFIAVEELGKVTQLRNFWISKKERGKKLGYKLIKNAITKTKSKRIYIICKLDLLEYYQLIGFEEVKQTPEEVQDRLKFWQNKTGNSICMLYNKIKHKKDKSFSQIPDLVVIDGGKGQLNCGTKVFQDLNLKIPYISLAKRLEEIFVPGKQHSIILEKNNNALKLLQRARDEAHRFAISFNRNLRTKRIKPKRK